MAGYSMDDIETIRRKSGISYEEAAALLQYHGGDLLQALMDLERNGKLKDDKKDQRRSEKPRRHGIMELLENLYCVRVRIRRGNATVLNLSVIIIALLIVLHPWFALLALALSLILGYKISFIRHDTAFEGADLQDSFQHAADHMKSSFGEFTRGFSEKENAPGQDSGTATTGFTDRSGQTHRAPSMQVPYRGQGRDGSVSVEQDQDGFTSATIQ